MKKASKKLISICLALLMFFGTVPYNAISAYAGYNSGSCWRCGYTFQSEYERFQLSQNPHKPVDVYSTEKVGSEIVYKLMGNAKHNNGNTAAVLGDFSANSISKTWSFTGNVSYKCLSLTGNYTQTKTVTKAKFGGASVPPGQYLGVYLGQTRHILNVVKKTLYYCPGCGRLTKTTKTGQGLVRVPLAKERIDEFMPILKTKKEYKREGFKKSITKTTSTKAQCTAKNYDEIYYNSTNKIKANANKGKSSKAVTNININAKINIPKFSTSKSKSASVSLLSNINSIFSIFKPMTVYAASGTILIPRGTTITITEVSDDGMYGKTTYKGTTCWVNLSYVSYYVPTITKPDPPTVTLKSAEDIKLGDLITVEWNTPTDAKYFSAILKDSSGNQVERYDNIYGNSTSFQSQKAGKYTVEVIANNSEYSSDPGNLGKTVTVHDFVNITFKDEDGTELGTQKIPWGDNAVSLIAPEKRGYTFKGWNGSLYNVKNDIVVTAQYDKAKYTVEFIGYQANEKGIPNKEVLLKKETVEYGTDATAPTDDEIVVPKNYEFMGWSSEEYKNVYTPYKNESIKIYAVYGWKNKDLPISCEITSAVRQANGYYVYYNLENYPDAITRGRVIVALKTSEGKLIDMTESSAFSLEKGETETGARIFIPCEKAATTAEIFIVNGYTNNGMSDGIPISNKDSSTVVEGKMWSDWGTTPIEDNGDNEVESRIEYSFRNLRETTGNTKIKPDWVTLMNDGVIKHGDEYNARLNDTSYVTNDTVKRTDNSGSVSWSGWSWNQVTAFDTESKRRDIQTQQAIKSYNQVTQWNYSRYKGTSGGKTRYGPCAGTWSSIYCGTYQERGWGGQLSCYGSENSNQAGFFYKYNNYNDSWYNETTRQVNGSANYGTQWRYRDCTYTYYFYRWEDKDWSDWSADEVAETNKREVQTRTVYREKSVSAGIEDVTGEMRTFSGSVDPEFAGKNITFFVSKYNAISDFTDEYVAQSTIGEDGSYTFNYKLREEPTAETGDFTIMIGIEGTTEKQVVGTIEAPKPVYTVKFYGDVKDNNPEVVYEAKVRQGETTNFPEENPEIAGKRFICWNSSGTNVQSDMEVYPVFEDIEYTVVFVDWRLQRIETQKYKYGEPLVPPTTECTVEDANGDEQTVEVEVVDVESGYGRGWDYEEGTLVTSDMVVTAQYETKTFDVTFHDYDGTVIDTQTVEYDGVADTPEISEESENYLTEDEWNIDMEELYGVKENIDVFPSYNFEKTTPDPISSLETGVYNESQMVTLSCEDENAVIYYTTDGTEPKDNLDAVEYTAPIIIDSKTELKFYASSMGKNDSEVMTEKYVINDDAVLITIHDNIYGEEKTNSYLVDSIADFDAGILEVEGYTLVSIYNDNEYTEEATIDASNTQMGAVDMYAKYSIDTYTVTFEKEDGTIYDTQTVSYGDTAESPSVKDEGTLKFIGWDSDAWERVIEDITVHPIFKEESEIIDVTFDKAKYQMELDSTYQINATITAPEGYDDLNDAVIWYSDNEEVATVDNTGVVTSVGAGTANIYAVSVDDINIAVCEITVKPSINNSILINNLSALDVDSEGYLRRIPLDGTNTVDNISANFLNSSEQLTFTNSKGNVISGNNLVGTNTVISLMNGEKVIDSMAVIMTGDVTCDGAVNNRDVAYAARVIVKRNTADAGQLRAMDVNGDGKVNNRDVAMLSRYLVGKETINN